MPTLTPPDGGFTPEHVQILLYRAGATLIALYVAGVRPREFASCMPVPSGTIADDLRYPPPSAARISEMDQVLSWVKLIPEVQMSHRKVVQARLLCRPDLKMKPIYSFERIGDRLGVTHVTARSYWVTSLGTIAGALNRPLYCQASAFAGTRDQIPKYRPDAVPAAARRVLEREVVAA